MRHAAPAEFAGRDAICGQTEHRPKFPASRENDRVQCTCKPSLCVRLLQSRAWSDSDFLKEPFQRNEPFSISELNADTHAGLVGTAKDPVVVPSKRVSPERLLTQVQRDAGRLRFLLHRQLSKLAVVNGMNCCESGAQLMRFDPASRITPLPSRLGFRHALLDRFDSVPADERTPRTDPAGLQDRVRVNEHRTLVKRHVTALPGERRRALQTGPPNLRWSSQEGGRRGEARCVPVRSRRQAPRRKAWRTRQASGF